MPAALPARALLLVVAGRAADSLTTAYGLQTDGVQERNPVVATLLDAFGTTTGLLVANVVALVTLIVGVELAARLWRDGGVSEGTVDHFRTGCYALFGTISLLVAVHNLRVIAMA